MTTNAQPPWVQAEFDATALYLARAYPTTGCMTWVLDPTAKRLLDRLGILGRLLYA